MGFTFISVAAIKCSTGGLTDGWTDRRQLWGGGRVYSSSQSQVSQRRKVAEVRAGNTLCPVKSRRTCLHSAHCSASGFCSYPVQDLEPRDGTAHFQAGSSPSVKATEKDPYRHTHRPISQVMLQHIKSTNLVWEMVLLSETWNQQLHLQNLPDAIGKGDPPPFNILLYSVMELSLSPHMLSVI